MGTPEGGQAGGDAALRAEHDALWERLQIRRSIDELRTATYTGFAALVSFGLTLKFAWDRWGSSRLPRPVVRTRIPWLFLLAVMVFVALAVVASRALRRARVHRSEEEPLAARFHELRKQLRLDP